MSDLEVSSPTREEMFEELTDLRADRAIGAQLLDAARARSDQDAAALREVTADRDRWQSAAENLRSELWRQVDELRAETVQQRDQITQLSVSLAALLEAIVGTTPTAEAIEAASDLAAGVPVGATVEVEISETAATAADVPAVAAAPPAAQVTPRVVPDPAPVVAASPPTATADVAEAEPVAVATDSAPAPSPAPASSPAPAPVLAPYVPANEPARPHLQPKPEAPELVPHPDHDRVGVLSELMAVAVDSVPATAGGSPADRAEESLPAAPTGMNILPVAEPVPAKRRRLGRLSG